jgi:hypothetical protein
MTHPAITNAIEAGLLEPCVVLDSEGREIHAFRPTEQARHWFGPPIDQSPRVDASAVHGDAS